MPNEWTVDRSKTVEVKIMRCSPYSSPYPIVFALEVSSRNSNAFPAKQGSNKGSGENMLFSSFMRYLENGTRYVQSYLLMTRKL